MHPGTGQYWIGGFLRGRPAGRPGPRRTAEATGGADRANDVAFRQRPRGKLRERVRGRTLRRRTSAARRTAKRYLQWSSNSVSAYRKTSVVVARETNAEVSAFQCAKRELFTRVNGQSQKEANWVRRSFGAATLFSSYKAILFLRRASSARGGARESARSPTESALTNRENVTNDGGDGSLAGNTAVLCDRNGPPRRYSLLPLATPRARPRAAEPLEPSSL